MKLLTFKRRIGLKCGLDEFELTIYTFYFLFNDECWISIEGRIWEPSHLDMSLLGVLQSHMAQTDNRENRNCQKLEMFAEQL